GRAAPPPPGREGGPNPPRGHPCEPGRRSRAGGVDPVGRAWRERDVLGTELGARDLQDDVRDALADLRRGAPDLRSRQPFVRPGPEPHARGAGVVEALRVADVLEPNREADPA